MNFDNIINSLITLFIISTRENWPNYIFYFVDQDKFSPDGENLGPEKNSNLIMMIYFIVFILIGSYFLINLFIGVVQLNYHLSEKAAKSKIITEKQSQWIQV